MAITIIVRTPVHFTFATVFITSFDDHSLQCQDVVSRERHPIPVPILFQMVEGTDNGVSKWRYGELP